MRSFRTGGVPISDLMAPITGRSVGMSKDAEHLSQFYRDLLPAQFEASAYGQSRLDILADLVTAQAEAQEENWDGYDASPVQQQAVRDAAFFLLRLPFDFPPPGISIDPDGDIALDWEGRNGSVVMLSFHGQGIVHYAARFSAVSKLHGTEQLDKGRVPETIAHCLNRLLRYG